MAQTDNILSVHCPIHRDVEIGECCGDIDAVSYLAFYCGKCRRLIRFNKESLEKNVTPLKKCNPVKKTVITI